jgi:uncharacterized membrane protein YfcA
MTTLLAAATTFAFTTALTIAGVGAAFVLIPVFIALGVEVHAAMATALLLNAVAMSVASARNARKGMIEFRLAVPILVAASVLSPLGAWVSQGLGRRTLVGLFVAFLLFAAAMILFHTPRSRRAAPPSRAVGSGVVVGAVAGFVGGLLGVGGGNVIVPALVWLGIDPKRASATASFAIIFSSLAGFLGHATLAGADVALVGTTAVASAAGALLGSYLMTEHLKSAQVKTVLGVVLLAVAAKMGWGSCREPNQARESSAPSRPRLVQPAARVALVPMSEDSEHAQEHVDDRDQRCRDDDHQPEQSFWLSGFHARAIPFHAVAGAARWGRVR